MKRIFAIIFVFALILNSSIYAFSETPIKVKLNNKEISFDVAPQIINGRTMVPLRKIFEALDIQVTWDDKTQTVTGKKHGLDISLQIDNATATVNGKEVQLDTPATVIDGYTLVPVRFLAESTGSEVNWDNANNTVIITSKASDGILVSTAKELTDALSKAKAGDVILLKAGVTFDGKFVGDANGTSSDHIVLKSESAGNPAVLRGIGSNIGYGLHITGDYWEIRDLKVTNSQKGIILDNSNYSLIYGCDIYGIGMEGIHLRDGSSYCVVDNSKIHDTGTEANGYGEGIYIGTDNKAWSTFNPNCNSNIVQSCTFGPNITADCIDVKEGTKDTIIKFCTFDGTGATGENGSEDMVNLKGDSTVVYANTFNQNGNTKISDAIHVQNRGTTLSGTNSMIYWNTFNMADSTQYLVQSSQGACTYKVWGNTRTPSGNTYSTIKGTTYTSSDPGAEWPKP